MLDRDKAIANLPKNPITGKPQGPGRPRGRKSNQTLLIEAKLKKLAMLYGSVPEEIIRRVKKNIAIKCLLDMHEMKESSENDGDKFYRAHILHGDLVKDFGPSPENVTQILSFNLFDDAMKKIQALGVVEVDADNQESSTCEKENDSP